MQLDFDLDAFIRAKVTRRATSLLAQDLHQHDDALRARLAGRHVLVIGGAGSIGAAYIKAVLRFPIASLCVVDLNENGLTELVRDLRSTAGLRVPERLLTYPVGLGDRVFEKIVRQAGPFEVVANFAAHKHVRSEKDIFSIEAMLTNNVVRARQLLELLTTRTPERFFCVSTDKAANPVNIMGASKKLMEEVILAFAGRVPATTARFANVAFSNGSLPLGFLERLSRRQPWSCPRGIRRYFVSPQEAGELCLLASILGEAGSIFFPKLEASRDLLAFTDVAQELLAALGLAADLCGSEEEARQKAAVWTPATRKYPVYFFDSDTSGEKPDEEFVAHGEEPELAHFAALGVIRPAQRRSLSEVDAIIGRLQTCLAREEVTKAEVVAVLREYLPTFAHIETGKQLDQRM